MEYYKNGKDPLRSDRITRAHDQQQQTEDEWDEGYDIARDLVQRLQHRRMSE